MPVEELNSVIDTYPGSFLRMWLKAKSLGNQNSPDLLIGLLKQFQPKSILEIGCGFGLLSHYLSMQNPDAEVHGIDLDKKRIVAANESKRPQNLTFSHQNALDLEDRSWDCVVMVDVLHHAGKQNQKTIINKIFHLLKPGGRMVVREIEPGVSLIKYAHAHIFDWIFYWQRSDFMDVDHLKNLIKEAGFSNIEVHQNYPPSWAFPYVTYVASKD